MAYTILVADDEAEIRELLRLYLENENFHVIEAADGLEALERLKEEKVHLCLLDIMMPNMDGYRTLQQIRKTSNIPVLILSAKDQDADKILGLNLGADDYISKPFNPLEAVARVNSAIRRYYSLGADETLNPQGAQAAEAVEEEAGEHTIKVRDLVLDQDACLLYRGDEMIELTSVEYKVLEMFMSHPGKVYTKQQIWERGWGEEYFVGDNNIMVCISKLRTKLDAENSAKYIKTIRGLGYRFEKE